MSKYCSECGTKLVDGANACHKCATLVNKPVIQQPVYIQNKKTKDYSDVFAIIGFVLGFLAIPACFYPIVGFPITIPGLICSNKGKTSKNIKGLATCGFYFAIFFLSISVLIGFLGVLRINGIG